MNWHTLTIAETTDRLGTNLDNGLTKEQAEHRLADYGPNELEERGGRSPWKILWEQLTSVMVLILIAAAVISALLGKATETAAIAGLDTSALQQALPREAELPFDSERKRMTTVHSLPNDPAVINPTLRALRPESPYLSITKGAVDGLLAISSHIWTEDGVMAMDESWRERVSQGNEQLAQNGMRVLGMGYRWLDHPSEVAESQEV